VSTSPPLHRGRLFLEEPLEVEGNETRVERSLPKGSQKQYAFLLYGIAVAATETYNSQSTEIEPRLSARTPTPKASGFNQHKIPSEQSQNGGRLQTTAARKELGAHLTRSALDCFIGPIHPANQASNTALRKGLHGMHEVSLIKLSTVQRLIPVDRCAIREQDTCAFLGRVRRGQRHSAGVSARILIGVGDFIALSALREDSDPCGRRFLD